VSKNAMMRVVLVLMCLMCSLGNGLPFTKSESVTPSVNGFLKTAYSRIEEADVKSLTISMIESYRALCAKFGAWTVSQELGMIYESHSVDLKLSMARLNKLGSLLRRLEEEAVGDDDDDGGESGRASSFMKLRREGGVPI
jgi:hypothetical protein